MSRFVAPCALALTLFVPVAAMAEEPCQAHAEGHGGVGAPGAHAAAEGHAAHGQHGEGCTHGSGEGGCDRCAQCADCDACEDDECACEGCVGRVALDLRVGLQLISRHQRFVDDVYGVMRRYDLPAGPAVSVGGRWFPGAHFTRGVGSAFGVDLRFDRSFGITTDRSGLIEYDTVQRIVELSAIGRYVGRSYEVTGGAGFGSHAFALRNGTPTTPDFNPTPDTPNVNYRYLRLGLDARFMPFDFLGFGVGAAALVVFDAGGADDASWFPRADVGGVTLQAQVLVPLPHDLELRAGVEYRRYFYDMNARLGDPVIVGGALDQYAAAELAVAYRH